MFDFVVLDPRKPVVPANTLGIEVTSAAIAAMCDLGNIDPQHGGHRDPGAAQPGDENIFIGVHGGAGVLRDEVRGKAAVDTALAWPLPAAGTTLATIRPDLDSIGAMAVLALRRTGGLGLLAAQGAGAWNAFERRVNAVAAADGNARTTWTARALPTTENPWPDGVAIDSRRDLAAIGSIVSDHNRDMRFRVACAATWLLGGESATPDLAKRAVVATGLPVDYEHAGPGADEAILIALREARASVEAERADMIAAISDGRINIEVRDGLAIVHSVHRAATMLGHCVAPLAICFHPAFPWPLAPPTPKATIAWAVPPGAEVVTRVIGALNRAERNAQGEPLRPGDWGGNVVSGIVGSPQSRASALTKDEIVSIVRGAD